MLVKVPSELVASIIPLSGLAKPPFPENIDATKCWAGGAAAAAPEMMPTVGAACAPAAPADASSVSIESMKMLGFNAKSGEKGPTSSACEGRFE